MTEPIDFDGYYLEEGLRSLPNESGVYCVYSCSYIVKNDSVRIYRLLYIGESEDLNQRLNNHERMDDWKEALKTGEVLCFSYALVGDEDRKIVETALIYEHKPLLNTDNKDTYNEDPIRISLSGETGLLHTNFVVPYTNSICEILERI